MAKKLNSMRLLEQHKVPYEVLSYDGSAFHSADEVAAMVGYPAAQVFKTLVVESAKRTAKPWLAVLPGNSELDLKKMASAAGEKKVQLMPQKDAERETKLQVGGISSLALMHKHWDVYLDVSATDFEHILMSAGERGTQVKVAVTGFVKMVGATVVDIRAGDNG
ncbi:MAG: aminoacyl-tRNA deacylase [Chloroflexota bacterium]